MATQIDASRQVLNGSITNAQQNFGTPVNPTDVAIKSYVDATAQGLAVKPSAAAATAASLPTNTYSANVITASANGALTVDGYAVATNDYILVKNETTQANNGLYIVTNPGTVGAPFILTRASAMTTSTQFNGAFVFVEQGTVNASAGFVQTAVNPTVGSTPIVFQQFSGAGEITVDTTLTKTGNQLSRSAITGDVTISAGSNAATVTKINGVALSGLSTGILKNTTGTGAPSIAVNTDLPIMTATQSGAVPTPPNSTTQYLRGDGTWAALPAQTYDRATAVSGTQNSSNKVFTIANSVYAGSEQVFLNGQLLTPGSSYDYVLSGTTLTFQTGFTAPTSTDIIRVYGEY